MSKKYYVVWKGRKTGIFSTWDECKSYVENYPGAKFKSFPSLEEAEQAFKEGYSFSSSRKLSSSRNTSVKGKSTYIEDSLSVDAACSGNPGLMEYKGVSTKTGEVIFHHGPMMGTNNIGEFLAIVHGLSFLHKLNSDMPIYSDSQTAIKWVKMKKANTTLPLTSETERVWKLIKRAENWLATHSYSNPIMKWETEIWGEIKADFGRK